MSDIMLTQVASLLRYSSSCQNVDGKFGETCPSGGQNRNDSSPGGEYFVFLESISYPSLSLTHPPGEAGSTTESSFASSLREDIRVKASGCMSQPVKVQQPSEGSFKTVARIMLENFLDSFDQLVDARIRQYSKVLSNHGLSLLSASGRADIVEYKLRTLLEIGTNISFGSISIKFENTTSINVTTTTTSEKRAVIPVMLKVEIDSLQFHPPNPSCHNNLKRHRNKLTFHAPGIIQGKPIHTPCYYWFCCLVVFKRTHGRNTENSPAPCCLTRNVIDICINDVV
jgi:hypothetical protein